MGQLIDGVWTTEMPAAASTSGRFARARTVFHGTISADGSSGHKTEAGRYHLYVAHACPWAHRTMIVRKLKRLEAAISVSVVDPIMGEDGWHFSDQGGAAIPDSVNGARYLRDIYVKARPDYTGRVTVPVLWDKAEHTIVNNESAEIIRMFDTAFAGFGDASLELYPLPLRAEIDAVNALVYANINNGVYKCGFASSQAAYEEAFDALFDALDEIERRLGQQRYLVGGRRTEADWRLFTTLVRFDAVYVGHFKCNLRRVEDYPHLSNYLRELYQVPGIAETVNMDHIKRHYYQSHESINPRRIVAKGPDLDFSRPHDRARLAAVS